MNNFLLTYIENDRLTYSWFETEEEMHDYVEGNPQIKIEEALELTVVRTFDYKKNED